MTLPLAMRQWTEDGPHTLSLLLERGALAVLRHRGADIRSTGRRDRFHGVFTLGAPKKGLKG